MANKVLLTGGSGLLGQHLQIEADRPTHKELDILNFEPKPYDLIIHSAAYTDVAKAEVDRMNCFKVNVEGTLNLLNQYPNVPFVYISTEYAHKPVNFYSVTKSIAEQLVMSHTAPYLIIRTLFKPSPWPFDKAFKDQWTQGGYVTDIAPRIDQAIKEWDGKSKMIYVGNGRKTMYELARQTRPSVIGNSVKDIKGVKIPSDYK